jgi:hypothetical protein
LTQHVAESIRRIKWCAAEHIAAKFALFPLKYGRIIRFPNLSRLISRVSSRHFQSANTLQNPPSRKFVGKTPTEILDFSVNQLGCLSDFHRLPLSGKCTLTISVPFVVFFNASEQTFYQA